MTLFTESQVRALHTLVHLWSSDRFALIGATAMRWHMDAHSRETYDLDLVLAASLDRYPAGLEAEPGWTRDVSREHSWHGPGDVRMDILPAGVDDPASGILTWPGSGFRMNTAGLRLALQHAAAIEPVPGLTIRVAPLEVIAVLKMVAYLDRPYERERDLEDIALILDEYIGATDDRRYAEEILELGLRYEETSPYLLGKRSAAIVGPPEREAVRRFVDLANGTTDLTATQARMLALAPPGWHGEPAELLLRFAAFERGFSAAPRDQ